MVGSGPDVELTKDSWQEGLRSSIEANRAHRDTTIERRILELRRAGGLALTEAATPRDPWPPIVADPFPQETALPEIRAATLDPASVGGAIQHHGALLVRELVAPAQAVAMRESIDRALEASKDPDHHDRAEGWYAPLDWSELDPGNMAFTRVLTQDTGGLLAVDSPRAFFLFTELLDQAGVVDVFTDYLGERPLISIKKTTFRRIRSVIDPAWHQDGSFLGADVRAVNLWLSLSHCGGETGNVGLDVIPTRVQEILETGTHDAPAAQVAIGQRVVTHAAPVSTVTPEFRPGDALLFDERFVHRTSAKLDDPGERYAIESWFFAPSRFPVEYGGLFI